MTVSSFGDVVLDLLNVIRDGRDVLSWFGKIARGQEQAESSTEDHLSWGIPSCSIDRVIHSYPNMDEMVHPICMP